MGSVLTGAGHFGFGFVLGAITAVCLIFIFRKSLFIHLYAPFLPFFLGVFAALPYIFVDVESCEFPLYLNVFLFYPLVHCHDLLIKLLGNLYVVVIVCGGIYCLFVLRYIVLVKRVRHIGWSKGKTNA